MTPKRAVRPSLPSPPGGTIIPARPLTYLWSVTAESSPPLVPRVPNVLPILLSAKRPLLLLARSLRRLKNEQVLRSTCSLDTLYPKLHVYNVTTEKHSLFIPILAKTPPPYYLQRVLPYIYAFPPPGSFLIICLRHYLGHSPPVLLSDSPSPLPPGPLASIDKLIP